MKQPGLKHYCKNCAVKRYFNFDKDKKWCTKCNCEAADNMRCKFPENFEPKYTLEQIRKINNHK